MARQLRPSSSRRTSTPSRQSQTPRVRSCTSRKGEQWLTSSCSSSCASVSSCAGSSWEKTPDDSLRKDIPRPSHQTCADATMARLPCLTFIAPSRGMAVRRQRIPRSSPCLNLYPISRRHLLRTKSSRRQTKRGTRKVCAVPYQRRNRIPLLATERP